MKLSDLLSTEDNFENFDLSEIQLVLKELNSMEAIDLPHAEKLQQLCLRASDLISNYSSQLVKIIGTLEAQLNKERNKALVDYKPANNDRVTADVRKAAAESSDTVEQLGINIAKAKAAKNLLDKKYDIISKSFYYYKEIASGFNRTLHGFAKSPTTDYDNGWDSK